MENLSHLPNNRKITQPIYQLDENIVEKLSHQNKKMGFHKTQRQRIDRLSGTTIDFWPLMACMSCKGRFLCILMRFGHG